MSEVSERQAQVERSIEPDRALGRCDERWRHSGSNRAVK
jgi:hypothetical protein